jgi:alpha-tubulin suppressor-like RCC1 family protein
MEGEYPSSCSLGRRSSFVLTNLGRCFAFGTSEEGMLGLGPKITEMSRPSEIALPAELRGERITVVSAGVSHVLACTERGRVLAWGSKIPSGLDLRSGAGSGSSTGTNGGTGSKAAHSNNNPHDDHTQWSPRQVELSSKSVTRRDYKIVSVGAGYDCSMFVTESGRVLSCGLSSGRLGLGEAVGASPPGGSGGRDVEGEDAAPIRRRRVATPQPLWGGLRLWYDQSNSDASLQQLRRPNRRVMHRGTTIS